MPFISNTTNSIKNGYNHFQKTTQPLRDGKNTLRGTMATYASLSALAVSSALYATGRIGAAVPLTFAAANLGSWLVYGNKMYTRYLPRMHSMAVAKICIGQPKSEPTGAWGSNDGLLTRASERSLGKGTAAYWQFYNKGLCVDGILPWCKEIGAASVLDVCCGEEASYVKALNQNGLDARGIDLNLGKAALESGNNTVANALEAFPSHLNQQFDLVLSIEAGAKLPKGSEKTYIQNLALHASKAVFCSWPVPGQEGPHQQNCLTNEQVTAEFNQLGWERDFAREKLLKASVDPIDFWFNDTLMVFVPKK